MTLAELLVDYNLVELPLREYNVELPISRFLYLSNYVDNKTSEKKSEEPTEDKSKVTFTGWTYKQPSSKSEKSEEVRTSWSSPYKDLNGWVSDMVSAYKRLGLNDNAIRNLIAKNALESGWGRSAQGDYNFGNITTGSSWKGNFVEGNDKDKDGKPIKNKFRSYNSLDDFVKDEVLFLTKLYDFNLNDDLTTFLNKLQGGNSDGRKYAEDPSYKNKIRNVYKQLLNGKSSS